MMIIASLIKEPKGLVMFLRSFGCAQDDAVGRAQDDFVTRTWDEAVARARDEAVARTWDDDLDRAQDHGVGSPHFTSTLEALL